MFQQYFAKMPRIKSVSLSEKYLVVIVKNVDKFCIKSAKKQLGEVDVNVAELCDSPCNRLPSLLLDKLVMMLLEACRLGRTCLEFLISINHCTLDLSQCQQEEKAVLLYAGSIRSQNLKTLKLVWINIEPEYLNCISMFTHLQILEFSVFKWGQNIENSWSSLPISIKSLPVHQLRDTDRDYNIYGNLFTA